MIIHIFTDGACSGNPGPGGWGVVALLLPKNKKYLISGFDKNTTNNRMELKAVIEALRFSLEQNSSELHIYSDSAYVVNAINQKWIENWKLNNWKTRTKTDVKNKDLWIELNDLMEKIDFKIYKVKGHSGDKYNELADELAKSEIILNS